MSTEFRPVGGNDDGVTVLRYYGGAAVGALMQVDILTDGGEHIRTTISVRTGLIVSQGHVPKWWRG